MIFEINTYLAVYKRSTEEFVRRSDGRMDDLGADEYIALVIEEKNISPGEQKLEHPYVRIDGRDTTSWKSYSLAPGKQTRVHVYSNYMEKLSPGTHKFEYFINGESVYTGHFHLIRPWKQIMPYPSKAQIDEANGKTRSPFIAFWSHFTDVKGLTEYSIDFWLDEMDKGTYFCTMNFYMDLSSLKEKYTSLSNEYTSPGCAYCGFQQHGDGKLAMIMTVWDVICRDKNGAETVICAKQLYPEGKADPNKTMAEGSFKQRIREYQWKTKHPYRMLMQRSDSAETGNAVLTMWVCDLVDMRWDKLVSFDLGYKSDFIFTSNLGGFMENYEKDYAGSVRNVTISNIRGRDHRTGKWVAAEKMSFWANCSVPALGVKHEEPKGSYQFGSDGSSFWIITSGVDGLCAPPKDHTVFSVVHTTTDSPY